jgi:putative Mg2+ transporter-C (MgtC) family protein
LTLPDIPLLDVQLTLLVRLIIAGALAGVLGWEREYARKPAGFRTHIIVGIGSALFTVLGDIAVNGLDGRPPNWSSDPTRVIQAVATGIGFLGSGIIFVSGTGDDRQVRGLTTAASVWATAALGMTCALGFYVLAIGTTVLLLAVLRGLAQFERLNGE